MDKQKQIKDKFDENIFSIQYYFDFQNSRFQHASIFKSIQKPWEVLPKIQIYLQDFFSKNKFKNQAKIIGNVYIEDKNISIGRNTVIEHGAMIKGPCVIGQNCQIRKGAYIRGNVIIGDNCVIGNSCEIKNSIVMNQSQIPHFNYVGDSILGTKSHISAGAVISNLKLDGKNICLNGVNNEKIETKLRKFGAIIGDEAQIGCNAVINPGSLIGKRCRIYPSLSFRGVLETDKIYKLKQETQIVSIKQQIHS